MAENEQPQNPVNSSNRSLAPEQILKRISARSRRLNDSVNNLAITVDHLDQAVGRIENKVDDLVPAVAKQEEHGKIIDELAVTVWGEASNGGGIRGQTQILTRRVEEQEELCASIQKQKRQAVVSAQETRWRWRSLLYPAILGGIGTMIGVCLKSWLPAWFFNW